MEQNRQNNHAQLLINLDEAIKDISRRLTTHIDKEDALVEKIDAILIQTTKTNGRVTRLEQDSQDVQDKVQNLIVNEAKSTGKNDILGKVVNILLMCAGSVILALFTYYLGKHG